MLASCARRPPHTSGLKSTHPYTHAPAHPDKHITLHRQLFFYAFALVVEQERQAHAHRLAGQAARNFVNGSGGCCLELAAAAATNKHKNTVLRIVLNARYNPARTQQNPSQSARAWHPCAHRCNTPRHTTTRTQPRSEPTDLLCDSHTHARQNRRLRPELLQRLASTMCGEPVLHTSSRT